MFNKNLSNKIKNKTDLFAWVFVLVVMAAIAAGDVEYGPLLAQADESIESTAIDISQADTEASTGSSVQSFKFNKDTPITDALRVLAAKYQKNIVPSPKVQGILAFTTINDVTFEEAMDAVLGANFKYEQKGNLTKVYTKDEYKKIMEDEERLISKVFTLYYISAAEAIKLIDPVLSKAGAIQGSSPAETVVPTGESISAGSSGGDTMALNDTIIIRDYPEKIAEAAELVKKFDVRPKQVLIEATVLSALLDEDTELGIDWNLLDGFGLTGYQAVEDSKGAPIQTSGFATALKAGLRVGIQSGNLFGFINALEGITDTTILANPKILAVNKQLGQVYIGTKIGYESQITVAESGTSTSQVKFLETGTKLSFRPYIGNDGYIRMDIHAKDSSGTLKTNQIPDETSTELATNITVKDGQTIVIGGLFRDVVTSSRSQVPVLGDIPFAGALFRGTSDETQRAEVIVMLTPHIIEEPEETGGDEAVIDIAHKIYGTRMGVQWISRRRLAEDRYANAVNSYTQGDNVAALCKVNTALTLRPTYLEALRLRERILNEKAPEPLTRTERIMLGLIEQEESAK